MRPQRSLQNHSIDPAGELLHVLSPRLKTIDRTVQVRIAKGNTDHDVHVSRDVEGILYFVRVGGDEADGAGRPARINAVGLSQDLEDRSAQWPNRGFMIVEAMLKAETTTAVTASVRWYSAMK